MPGHTVCGTIYTVDEKEPIAECMRIRGRTIEAVGSYEHVQNSRPWSIMKPTVISIPPGSIVIPGLADSHAHILANGFKMQLQLDGAKSLSGIIDCLKTYILANPEVESNRSQWIGGMGWDQTKWPGGQFPTASDLDTDSVLRGRPIVLFRVDVHATWVSPRVLEIIGSLPETVEGGKIVRDDVGRPTGIFIDNAMELVPIPPWTDIQIHQYFDTTIHEALKYGLTSIHDAGSEPFVIDFLTRLADAGEIPLRLYLMGVVKSDRYWGGKLRRLVDYGKNGRLNLRAVKLAADGALGSWGAALLKPYVDKPETSGIMRTDPDVLREWVGKFQKDGWQVNVHCIGDRANQVVLDVFEEVLNSSDVDVLDWRPRIEHAEIMTPDDLERIGRLGVIPSVQPTHATSDMWYAETRLGPERIRGAYAYQTLLQGNNIIPLGSDFPVEGVNPLLGFYAAVSRLSIDGTSPHGEGGWYPSEALTRVQALKGMTLDAAYASFAEKNIGSLVVGKKADYVVLDRDIMTVPVGDILGAKVRRTVIDGEVAYQD